MADTPAGPWDRTEGSSRRSSRRVLVAVGVIFVIALALRLHGITFLLLHQPDAHERVWLRQLELLRAADPRPERDVDFGYYPQLPVRLALAVQGTRADVTTGRLADHVEAAAEDLVLLRRLSAVLSALVVPATWLLARQLISAWAAVLAAWLAGSSLLALHMSQQARPHAAGAALLTLALAAAVSMCRRPTWGSMARAGFALALAVSVLQSGVAAALSLVAAFVLRRRGEHDPGWRGLLVVVLPVVVAIFLAYPFLFASSSGSDAAELGVAADSVRFSGHAVFLDSFHGRGFEVLLDAFLDFDPWIFLLAIVGAVFANRRFVTLWRGGVRAELGPAAVVLACALPYVAVVGLYDVTYERFALPLVPLLACLAAYGAARASGLFSVRPGSNTSSPFVHSAAPSVIAQVLAALALAVQLAPGVHLVLTRAEPDTSTLAARWIVEADPSRMRALVLLGAFDLPLARDDSGLASQRPGPKSETWTRYQLLLSPTERLRIERSLTSSFVNDPKGIARAAQDPHAWLASLGKAWVVVDPYVCTHRPLMLSVYSALSARGRLVARFSPRADGDERPFEYAHDWHYTPTWWLGHALHSQRTGRVIEIYALTP